jgi:hypothetical protein
MRFVVGFEADLSSPSLSFLHLRFMMNGVALKQVAFLFTLLHSIPLLVNTADLSLCSSTDQAVHFRIFGFYVGAFFTAHKISCSELRAVKLACWPLEPEFAGSIPAEAVGFFRCGKNPQAMPSFGEEVKYVSHVHSFAACKRT